MKLNKLTILILIAIIAGLVLVIPIREKQHSKTMTEYVALEIQKDEARLETYSELTANYNDLYSQYNELYGKYVDHVEYVWQNFTITGYSANDPQQGTNNIVATTFNLDYTRVKNLPIIATDPSIIPLYSIVEIKDFGAFISLDTAVQLRGIE